MSVGNNDLPFPEAEEGGTQIPLVFKKTDVYSKQSIQADASMAMQKIMDEGMTDPLEVYTRLKTIQEFVSGCIDTIKDDALDELDRHGKDGAKIFGIPLIQKNSGKKYGFDNYDGWTEIDDKIKDLTEQRKTLEKQMKGAIGTAGIIDEDTGEVVPPAQVVSEGKTIIQATIPRK